ncbi:MAG: spore germination protein GerW family protein [Eubacteriales bacterium]
MEESKLTGVINTSLSNIKEIIDVNTVVGQPVATTGGTVIIPVSKVAMGYASGGVDFFGKNVTPTQKSANFGGGGGTGVTLTPVGFLITKADGSVEYLPVSAPGVSNGAPAPDKIDKIVDFAERSPEIVEKILKLIKKKKNNDEPAKSDDGSADAENAPASADDKTAPVDPAAESKAEPEA